MGCVYAVMAEKRKYGHLEKCGGVLALLFPLGAFVPSVFLGYIFSKTSLPLCRLLFVCLFVLIIHGSKAYKTYAGQKKTEFCPRSRDMPFIILSATA
jgi:hypothetical protein